MTLQSVKDYHCPRWEELPTLGLYLDQVMLVLDEALSPVTPVPQCGVTPTIINNYVKQKLLAPTQKKKYGREHLAALMQLFLLKRILSTAEIVRVLAALNEGRDAPQAYGLFCEELEAQLRGVPGAKACPALVRAALHALAGKIQFDLLLAAQSGADPAAEQNAEKKSGKKSEKKTGGAEAADEGENAL